MENDIKTFYNLVAERTADEWYSNNILLPSIREFLSLMPLKPRILDLGCGPGYESMRLYASLIHIPPEKIEDVLKRISEILNAQGFLLISIRDGEGINEKMTDLTVDGKRLRRTVYQYTKKQIVDYSEKNGLAFIKEGYLESSLQEYNWESYIFQKRKIM